MYHGGHYSTINHTRQHAQNLGKNILYGHTHDVQRSGMTHVDGAFAIIDWFPTGDFRIDVVDIYNGRTFVWGKEINGNKE